MPLQNYIGLAFARDFLRVEFRNNDVYKLLQED